jgi:hypothetical protein
MKTINCKHWSECGVKDGGCCSLNLYGGRPSLGTCNLSCKREKECEQWTTQDKSRGLGDSIAKVTERAGLVRVAKVYEKVTGKPCGCGGRQRKLNQVIKY